MKEMTARPTFVRLLFSPSACSRAWIEHGDWRAIDAMHIRAGAAGITIGCVIVVVAILALGSL